MVKGIFIALEGPEGAGKSSQKDDMATFLQGLGHEVVVTREPGGTPLAEEIREVLLRPREEPVSIDAELMLMFAARAQHTEHVIRPAVERGAIVICDRYVDSSYAYQSGGRGIAYERIEQLEVFINALTPDLTFFFDVDVETGLRRAAKRGALDRMEAEEIDFYHRVAEMYRHRMHIAQHRYWKIDGNLSYEHIWPQIQPALERVHRQVRYGTTEVIDF